MALIDHLKSQHRVKPGASSPAANIVSAHNTVVRDSAKDVAPNATKVATKVATSAVVMSAPGMLSVEPVTMRQPDEGELLVDVLATGISTGTEKLLWSGEMPSFPGMGYPLIPGYETVGRVAATHHAEGPQIGDLVFVGGAQCFPDYRNLFGGAASNVVVPAAKAQPIDESLGTNGLLMARAATAYHALHTNPEKPTVPDLIVGHGVLGRLMARVCLALGYPPPVVWENNPARHAGADGYSVIDPAADEKTNYRTVADVSGDSNVLNHCIAHLSRRNNSATPPQVILAGFYKTPVSFDFAPAFMRELQIQVAAEWQPQDIAAVNQLVRNGSLSLDGLITHVMPSAHAAEAYEIAFSDQQCLKMVLDWSNDSA